MIKYWETAKDVAREIAQYRGRLDILGDIENELYIRLHDSNHEPDSEESMKKLAYSFVKNMLSYNDKFYQHYMERVVEFNEDISTEEDDSFYDTCVNALVDEGYGEEEASDMVECIIHGENKDFSAKKRYLTKQKALRILREHLT